MKKILSNKHYELLQLLAQYKEFMSSEKISTRLGISRKTIKRYVDSINRVLFQYKIKIISMRGYGYALEGDIHIIEEILSIHHENNVNSRVKEVCLYVLSKKYITIDEVSQKIAYSSSTLNKLMPQVKKYLESFDLSLKSKPYYGIGIAGTELNIREFILDCAFIKTSYGEILCLLSNISEQEYKTVKNSAIDFLKQHNVIISDIDFMDLIMKITVCISRSKQNFIYKPLRSKYNNLIKKLVNFMEFNLNIKIPATEITYLSIYTNIIYTDIQNTQSITEEEVRAFVIETLKEMNQDYGELSDNRRIIRLLSFHVKLMFNRIMHKQYIENYHLQDIKANYILEIDYAIVFAEYLQDHFNIKIKENEIGYLAIYFAMIRKNKKQTKKNSRVVILCNYGIGISQLIKERIQEGIPNIEVIGIYPVYYMDIVAKQDIDLIISTVAVDRSKIKKPCIVINNILSEDLLYKVRNSIINSKDSIIFKYLTNNAFFKISANSREEALETISKLALENKIFNSKILDSIYRRERISSTNIGNLVAMPHALINNDEESAICVTILEKPINWCGEKVQIIFMISLNAEGLKEDNVFKYLYNFVKNASLVNKLVECEDFDSFVRVFI